MTRRNAGFTLVELMVAIAVLAVMMLFAWGSISQTVRAKKVFGAVQDRYREARNALTRIVHDVEMAYLSGNEDRTQVETRTFFVGESSGEVQSVRFSAFAHTPLYKDANESDQTVIAYYGAPDRDARGQENVVRRESKRMANQGERWDTAPAEAEILFTGVKKLKFTYFDVRANEWKDAWTTQGVEGSAGRVPDRVKVALTFVDENGKEITLTAQARVYLQEALNFYAN
ncbi:MAG TPA: type II secretion system protein [Haliangiales bacterium]|nr:type II secretion system protein [Haliangiales bacterium]